MRYRNQVLIKVVVSGVLTGVLIIGYLYFNSIYAKLFILINVIGIWYGAFKIELDELSENFDDHVIAWLSRKK